MREFKFRFKCDINWKLISCRQLFIRLGKRRGFVKRGFRDRC